MPGGPRALLSIGPVLEVYAGSAGALPAEEIPVEVREVVVIVLVELDQVAVANSLTTPGARGGPGLLVGRRRDVFALLRRRRPVGAAAGLGLQIDGVGVLA